MSTVACPACQRSTPVGRARCVYCGADLPPEIAAARRHPASQAAVPDDLDQLVAAALRGGGGAQVERLRHAMKEARGAAPRSAPTQPASAQPPAADPPPIDLAAGLDAVADAASAARRQWQAGRHDAAHRSLTDLLGRLPALIASLPEPPPPVELPPVRKLWLLVVEGLGDASRGQELAGPLDVDVATARQVALARHPKVAARDDQPSALWDRAAALRAGGVAAVVVSRPELESMPAAVLLVALSGRSPARDPWLVDPWPHWQAQDWPDATILRSQARPAEPLAATLAVPGEVVVVRRAQARDLGRTTHRRHLPGHTVGETRVSVLDLHGPGAVVRLIPGLTDLKGWPGDDQPSVTRAFRQLVRELPTALPGVTVLGSRICSPARGEHLSAEGPDRDRHVHTLSGWPVWEEHTRLCRRLFKVDPPPSRAAPPQDR